MDQEKPDGGGFLIQPDAESANTTVLSVERLHGGDGGSPEESLRAQAINTLDMARAFMGSATLPRVYVVVWDCDSKDDRVPNLFAGSTLDRDAVSSLLVVVEGLKMVGIKPPRPEMQAATEETAH